MMHFAAVVVFIVAISSKTEDHLHTTVPILRVVRLRPSPILAHPICLGIQDFLAIEQ